MFLYFKTNIVEYYLLFKNILMSSLKKELPERKTTNPIINNNGAVLVHIVFGFNRSEKFPRLLNNVKTTTLSSTAFHNSKTVEIMSFLLKLKCSATRTFLKRLLRTLLARTMCKSKMFLR